MRRLNQRGDTIVEVLIAIIVVSSVLVGAYVATNRTTNQNQSSQERAQATRLVQAQIEYTRANGGIADGKTCYSKSGSPKNGTNCVVLADGNPAGDTQPQYVLKVEKSLTSNVYTISAKWQSLLSGENNVTMYYSVGTN